MATTTGIEWTDGTWNPTVGCSFASPGCKNCYAMGESSRLAAAAGSGGKYVGLTQVVKGKPVWNSLVRLVPKALDEPFTWREPKLVFVNSMSDLFHEELTDVEIARVWAVMAATPQHRYQVLTKRPGRMLNWLMRSDIVQLVETEMRQRDMFAVIGEWPLPNVWIGVSVEDQRRANERIPILLRCPAAMRFLSMEPLLGPVDLDMVLRATAEVAGLDWIIAGGESGDEARPMHPDWVRGLRNTCATAGIPFFFKQLGEWSWVRSVRPGPRASAILPDGRIVPIGTPGSQSLLKVGKAAAGAFLDGSMIRQMPGTAQRTYDRDTVL